MRDLSGFGDGEFDLAISVGLLEHVTDPAAFADAAREIQRVAREYALVVPYRYGWIEPHYLVPFFPVLPRHLQNWLIGAGSRCPRLPGPSNRLAFER